MSSACPDIVVHAARKLIVAIYSRRDRRQFLRACFPTARSPTARYFGLCLGGVTLNFKLSGQFLRAVPKIRKNERKNRFLRAVRWRIFYVGIVL